MATSTLLSHLYRKLGAYLSSTLASSFTNKMVSFDYHDKCMGDDVRHTDQEIPEEEEEEEDHRGKLPWLTLPHDMQCDSLEFFDMSRSRVCRIPLPEELLRGVVVGSSKGWLVIAKEGQTSIRMNDGFTSNAGLTTFVFHKLSLTTCDDPFHNKNESTYSLVIPDTEIFLFNPVSGAIHQLPSLSTLPSYISFVIASMYFFDGIPIVADFISRIELSSAEPSEPSTIIALNFQDYEPETHLYLALCRLGDQHWSIFPSENDDEVEAADILFYNGTLCALTPTVDRVEDHIFRLVAEREVSIKLIPMYDFPELQKFLEIEHEIFFVKNDAIFENPRLAESINGELLLIAENRNTINHARCPEVMDIYIDHHGIEFEFVVDYPYYKTSGFSIIEMDPDSGLFLREVHSLSDQVVFLSGSSSVSVPAKDLPRGLEGNCIFFLENCKNLDPEEDEIISLHVSRESGTYCMGNGRTERSIPSFNRPLKSKVTWFTPGF